MKRFVLSPCGTSLLTNQAGREYKDIVSKNANKKGKDEVPENDRRKLEELISKVAESLRIASLEEAAAMSAELNGITKIYQGDARKSNGDFHFLLSTDTWLGEETAKMVKDWLENWSKGLAVEIYRQKDLQTEDISAFQLSLSELVKKLSVEIPEFSKKGYEIIFNLTGGFKSVQGFLQSIANFYSDETVYVFEKSSQLLRIPRLPVKMDAESIIKEQIDTFRKLALGMEVPEEELKNIPETLLLKIDNEVHLSPWGDVLWEQSKQSIYGEGLLQPPYNGIKYSKTFERSVSDLPRDRIALINKRMDQLARYLMKKENPGSLDFKTIRGDVMPPSTHEMDAWSDKDAKRIYGHFEEDVFVIDRLYRKLS